VCHICGKIAPYLHEGRLVCEDHDPKARSTREFLNELFEKTLTAISSGPAAETHSSQTVLRPPPAAEWPSSVATFHAEVLRRFSSEKEVPVSTNLGILQSSIPELARQAEETEAFYRFAGDLFKLREQTEYSSTEDWEDEILLAGDLTKDVLRRSGYYYAVAEGKDSRPCFERAAQRIPMGYREVRFLWVLEGCWFPRKSFNLAGCRVARYEHKEIEHLGPSPEICATFFPEEALSSKRFSNFWFVEEAGLDGTGYADLSLAQVAKTENWDEYVGYDPLPDGTMPEERETDPDREIVTVYHLAHLSDPLFPPSLPYSGSFLSSHRTCLLVSSFFLSAVAQAD
jgi:hypothetical protein